MPEHRKGPLEMLNLPAEDRVVGAGQGGSLLGSMDTMVTKFPTHGTLQLISAVQNACGGAGLTCGAAAIWARGVAPGDQELV
jgi:hypothetical protein